MFKFYKKADLRKTKLANITSLGFIGHLGFSGEPEEVSNRQWLKMYAVGTHFKVYIGEDPSLLVMQRNSEAVVLSTHIKYENLSAQGIFCKILHKGVARAISEFGEGHGKFISTFEMTSDAEQRNQDGYVELSFDSFGQFQIANAIFAIDVDPDFGSKMRKAAESIDINKVPNVDFPLADITETNIHNEVIANAPTIDTLKDEIKHLNIFSKKVITSDDITDKLFNLICHMYKRASNDAEICYWTAISHFLHRTNDNSVSVIPKNMLNPYWSVIFESLRRAIVLNPGNPLYRSKLADMLFNQKPDAIDTAESLSEINEKWHDTKVGQLVVLVNKLCDDRAKIIPNGGNRPAFTRRNPNPPSIIFWCNDENYLSGTNRSGIFTFDEIWMPIKFIFDKSTNQFRTIYERQLDVFGRPTWAARVYNSGKIIDDSADKKRSELCIKFNKLWKPNEDIAFY